METGAFIFVLFATLNIMQSIIIWVRDGEVQISAIGGWMCAIYLAFLL